MIGEGLWKQLSEKFDMEILTKIRSNIRPYQRLMSMYRCAIMEIETKLNVLNEEFSCAHDRNPIESIKTRLKSPESVSRKLKKHQLSFCLENIRNNIFDVAGVRVICSFPSDIYFIAESLVKQDDITLIERKDYIQCPKESGYRSLHLIVEVPIFLTNEKTPMKVEIQLRTIAMDFWASLEHKLQYKKTLPPEEAEEIRHELFECAVLSSSLDQRMENIKNKITQNSEKIK